MPAGEVPAAEVFTMELLVLAAALFIAATGE